MISCRYLSLVLTDMKGKLIVIDGGDGAGKATQAKLLIEHLRVDGHIVETLDFPQYTQNHFGKLIRECLDGKRGDFMKLDAKVVAALFAADRFESKKVLEDWLIEGKVVLLDRYVSANMMHQSARLTDDSELPELLDWIDHMEHEVYEIPRPDITFYFDIPFEIREKLKIQSVAEGKHTGELDVAEKDQEHQQMAEVRARKIVELRADWQQINCCCSESGDLRSREDIHEEVYQTVSKIL